MNKQEFLRVLERSLVMGKEEKSEVMRYYTEYFEDAKQKVNAIMAEFQEASGEEAESWEEILNAAEDGLEEAEDAQEEADDVLRDAMDELRDAEQELKDAERELRSAQREAASVRREKERELQTIRAELEEMRTGRYHRTKEMDREIDRNAENIVDDALRFAERTTRSVFTSLKDIFGGSQAGKEIHEFVDYDMEPFHTIRVDVENCPVTVSLSETDRYGVDAKFVVGDQTEWEINVVDGTLIVKNHTPRRMKIQIGFSGNNGKNSEYVRIYLPKVAMDIVELISSNASIQVEDVCTQTLIAETSNAVIRITDTKVLGELRADTSNGSIEIQLTGTENEYTIHADTSNAKIYVDGRVRGDEYHSHGGAKEVRLDTSNGRITIGFTGVN